jgi:hypothetical protein
MYMHNKHVYCMRICIYKYVTGERSESTNSGSDGCGSTPTEQTESDDMLDSIGETKESSPR